MPKAIWNGVVIAESEKFERVENNIYFPPGSLKDEYFKESDSHTICPWKGRAFYYHIEVNGKVNRDSAWYYPETKPEAEHIKDHTAFWKGVKIENE